MKAILISKDLLFITKVKEVAAHYQREVVVVKSEGALQEAIAAGTSGIILVDAEKTGVTLEAVGTAISGSPPGTWTLVSFFSHVHVEMGQKAKELLGGDVMPRSRFVQLLPQIFSSMS